jgi:hypothetical protein
MGLGAMHGTGAGVVVGQGAKGQGGPGLGNRGRVGVAGGGLGSEWQQCTAVLRVKAM